MTVELFNRFLEKAGVSPSRFWDNLSDSEQDSVRCAIHSCKDESSFASIVRAWE